MLNLSSILMVFPLLGVILHLSFRFLLRFEFDKVTIFFLALSGSISFLSGSECNASIWSYLVLSGLVRVYLVLGLTGSGYF